MRSAVERRCALLTHHRFGVNDIALVVHANSVEFLADLLAIWHLGGCAACLEPSASERELTSVVETLQPRVTLVARDSALVVPTGLQTLCLHDNVDDQVRSRSTAPVPQSRTVADEAALILFTSGTTASPRAVVHTYRALRARLSLNVAQIGRADLRRTLCVLPTLFGHGLIGNCLTPLYAGADLVLCAGAGLEVAARLGAIIDEHRITFFSSVPALWRMVLRLASAPEHGSLVRVHVGSAPLTGNLWRDIQAWCRTTNVVNAYGITEAANWVAGASGAQYVPRDGLVGKLWGGLAAVLTESGELRSAGHGELLIKTPSLMRGYFGQPQLSAATMHGGWYRTGDLVDIAADGTLFLGARLGLVINRAGINLHPEEIESVLIEHPHVLDACAFGVPDPFGGESLGCAVALDPGVMIQVAELAQWCAQRIRPGAVPDRWWILARIPRDERGKISRRDIARDCLQVKSTL